MVNGDMARNQMTTEMAEDRHDEWDMARNQMTTEMAEYRHGEWGYG